MHSERKPPATSWTRYAIDLGPTLSPAGTIGLLVNAGDLTSEQEFRHVLRPELGVYASRMPFARSANVSSLSALERHIPTAMQTLIPDDHVDVVAFGCTSGAMIVGTERIAELVHSVKPDVPVTDPSLATKEAFRHLGVRKLALLTPYLDEVNERVESHIMGQGFDLVAKGTFGQRGHRELCRIPRTAIVAAASELGRSEAEAVFICCTSMPSMAALDEIEAAVGKPVVSSNQALIWHALREGGLRQPIRGFGSLLADG